MVTFSTSITNIPEDEEIIGNSSPNSIEPWSIEKQGPSKDFPYAELKRPYSVKMATLTEDELLTDQDEVRPKSRFSFKKSIRRSKIKGASIIRKSMLRKYDTAIVQDPNATPSTKIAKSSKQEDSKGDGDVWVEMIFKHQATGNSHVFFVSKNTGKKVMNEPPSGASRVIYLRESERALLDEPEIENNDECCTIS
mmetsp:Transcript_25305/g.31182  ORF Transcript_25305/g.31182 Transcript_25305/m.31182 type:complete len:195 (+) Transcript_25305:155-739(+)